MAFYIITTLLPHYYFNKLSLNIYFILLNDYWLFIMESETKRSRKFWIYCPNQNLMTNC